MLTLLRDVQSVLFQETSAHLLGQHSEAPGGALKEEPACSSRGSELGDEWSQLVQSVGAPIAVMLTPECGRKRVREEGEHSRRE